MLYLPLQQPVLLSALLQELLQHPVDLRRICTFLLEDTNVA